MLSFLNIRNLIKGYQSTARSYSDLSPWATPWDNKTILTIDQGLLAVFEYDGIDPEGRPQYEVDATSASFERAFGGFKSGSYVWVFTDRRKTEAYPYGTNRPALTKFVEDEWAEQTRHHQYINKYSLVVFQRAEEGASKFFDMMDRIVKEEGIGLFGAFMKALKTKISVKENIRFNLRSVQSVEERLNLRIAEIENGLGRFGLRRLEGDELSTYLFNRFNPCSGDRVTFPYPKLPSQFLGSYLASDSMSRKTNHMVFTNGQKKKYVGVISLKGWPESNTSVGMLDYLLAVHGEVSISHTFQFIDREIASKVLDSVERFNEQASVPFLHRVICQLSNTEPSKFDSGRLALLEDARSAKIDLVANNRAFGYHNLTVLCYGDTEHEMDNVRSQIMRRLSDSIFIGRIETIHQLACFMQTLPGQWKASVRWMHISFGNVADIAPIRTLKSGSLQCAHYTKELKQGNLPVLISMPTDSGVPFNWDPFESGAGHTAFIGPTRAGKTAVVNMLLSIFGKYPNARVIRIDKDYSQKISTVLGGGRHVDLRADEGTGLRMCPISLVADKRHHKFVTQWVKTLVETLAERKLTPDEIDAVRNTIANLETLPPHMHTLRYVRAGIQSLGRYLDDWISQGSMAGWFDNEPNGFVMGDNMCFEMKRLFDNELVAEMAMDYLFYLIEDSLDGRPLVVNVEETWFFLRNKRFVARLEDFLRTIGKRNGALWITTQSATELTSSEELLPLLEQLKNKVFLPNAGILTSSEGYGKLGLTEEQLHRIQQAEPKRDYYFQTPSMTRMVHIRIPEALIPVITASSRALECIDRHMHSNVEDWATRYYEEMVA